MILAWENFNWDPVNAILKIQQPHRYFNVPTIAHPSTVRHRNHPYDGSMDGRRDDAQDVKRKI